MSKKEALCKFISCEVCDEILSKKSYNKHIQSKKHLTNEENQKQKTPNYLNNKETEPKGLANLYAIMHS